jgi:tubulin polyglutamylase TTLL9
MVHLTNHAVQKKDANYDAEKCDLRWSVRSLRQYIAAKHGVHASDEVIVKITTMIVNSLLSVVPIIIHDKHRFEMYGYDVMLDEGLRPWLIEVNASPSMSVDSKTDYELKSALFHDVLNVIDMEKQFVDGTETPRARVGGFDLIHHDGVVIEQNLSLLGGLNDDREHVLAQDRLCVGNTRFDHRNETSCV